jgi:hypothetical protein
MKVKTNLTILERELNELRETHGYIVPQFAYPYIRKAMIAFSVNAIHLDRQKRRKMMVDTLKNLPKWMFVGYYFFFRAKLKKWFYKMAVNQAKTEAIVQNRKIWVVQSTDLTYKLISTKDFRNAKSIKVFRKELTFQDMDDTAALTVYPPNKRK